MCRFAYMWASGIAKDCKNRTSVLSVGPGGGCLAKALDPNNPYLATSAFEGLVQ
jgi:hypothetical protein